jgi:hypothetical protein
MHGQMPRPRHNSISLDWLDQARRLKQIAKPHSLERVGNDDEPESHRGHRQDSSCNGKRKELSKPVERKVAVV